MNLVGIRDNLVRALEEYNIEDKDDIPGEVKGIYYDGIERLKKLNPVTYKDLDVIEEYYILIVTFNLKIEATTDVWRKNKICQALNKHSSPAPDWAAEEIKRTDNWEGYYRALL